MESRMIANYNKMHPHFEILNITLRLERGNIRIHVRNRIPSHFNTWNGPLNRKTFGEVNIK